jgi:hypothetical protein
MSEKKFNDINLGLNDRSLILHLNDIGTSDLLHFSDMGYNDVNLGLNDKKNPYPCITIYLPSSYLFLYVEK